MKTLKTYYYLTKPGIIYGNALTTTAGFFLGAAGLVNFTSLAGVLIGASLVIASACVFNNYIDRHIDKLMARTKKRALVSGAVQKSSAILYATLLGVIGFSVLAVFTNKLCVYLGILAFFSYIVLYGYSKRRSVHGTLVGSISGALPPVAGYAAATNTLDTGALLLFLILVFWQMPHFYAIAIFRSDDYKAAKIPVLPLVKGLSQTKLQMIGYIVAFFIACALLTVFGYTSYIYLLVMGLLSFRWFSLALQGFNAKDDKRWARKLFGFSLIVLLGFSIMISVDSFIF